MIRPPGVGLNNRGGLCVRLSGTLLIFAVCELSIIIDVAVVALIYFIAAGEVDFSVDQGADVVR